MTRSGRSQPTGPPRLLVDPTTALAQFDRQLELVSALDGGHVQLTQQGIETYRRERNQWRDVTYEILRRLFDSEEYADSFYNASHGAGMLTTYDSPQRHFHHARQGFLNAVARLQAIREIVASVLPSAPARDPEDKVSNVPRFRDLHIHIDHGSIGQLNVADTVRNIETKIMALGGQADTENVALALKAMTEAIVGDPSIPDSARQDLIEHFGTLAEAANMPAERRRGSTIRAILGSVPALLGTAIKAHEAWNAWGPTLGQFFNPPVQP